MVKEFSLKPETQNPLCAAETRLKSWNMWSRTCYSLTFALLLMGVWSAPKKGKNNHEKQPAHEHHNLHGGTADETPPHFMNSSFLTFNDLSAEFAFGVYRKLSSLADNGRKNIFFSPLSISMALSMLALGAKAETHSQIFSTLGYSSFTPDEVNNAFKYTRHMLGHGKDVMMLQIGGALAIREGFKPLDKFLIDAKHFYDGETLSVDFSKPDSSVQEINKYISKKTEGSITDTVKRLEQDTVMMLVNYIYFRGKWEKPFKVEQTRKADFHVDQNTRVTVDMMSKTSRFSFYRDRENFTSVIMVPYKGNMSMMAVLPEEGKMEEVESKLHVESLKHWHSKLLKKNVRLSMPKFSISSSLSLGETLKDMGMVAAFSHTANFSGISEEIELKASEVLHQAVLKVDEKGTEAAAVTTVEAIPMSMPQHMNLNRPFLVFIIEETSPVIMFMGKISNPDV